MSNSFLVLISTGARSLLLVGAFILAHAHGAAGQVREVVVPHGLEVSIAIAEDLTSKSHLAGEAVSMVVMEDVIIGDLVVISRNTPVRGIVEYSKKGASFGRNGTLCLGIDSTRTVDGEMVKLRGSYIVLGPEKRIARAMPRVVVRFLRLFNRGRDARIKAGTAIKAYVEEERRVAMKLPIN